MMRLVPVGYHQKTYPAPISAELYEMASHMDKASLGSIAGRYSLHTEYSYASRGFDTELIRLFPALCEAQRNGIPQLWKNEVWAEQFARFIVRLVGSNPAPTVIEIHPPFADYCPDTEAFVKRYRVFEEIISNEYPGTGILIENRAGSLYRGAKFLVSKERSIKGLCDSLANSGLRLKMVLDYPQLFTAENYRLEVFPISKFIQVQTSINTYRDMIGGIHLWGKTKSASGRWVSHVGTLDKLFCDRSDIKTEFLAALVSGLDDDVQRFFVPEVNSGEEDLHAIVRDLLTAGASFISF